MNRLQALLNREQALTKTLDYDFALRRLCVAKEDSWRGISPSCYNYDFNPEPPIFSAKFANCANYRHILAIANEDGKIALQDTTKRNYEPEEKSLSAPQCHYNAVFDLEWAPGEMKFISASGDHTARLWQVDGSGIRDLRTFMGHSRSVKTAAFRKTDPYVFATGGRDGAIIIWDTRAKLNTDQTPRADNYIYSGHMGGPSTPQSQRKRTRTPKLASTASNSITGLAFQDTNTLISCGAGDGVIKVWDLRRNYSVFKKEPQPKHSLPYAGTSTFKGFTNLLVDESGARLYANCMDNTIYCYNLFSYSPEPLARYKGLITATFYIKACLSPDGKYLLSGSSDESAYIWNLKYADEPLLALAGHNVEVTCVAWGATHDCPIVTCSDDARHKIWRIGPEQISDADSKELYRGTVKQVRSLKPIVAKRKYANFCELSCTPRSMKRLVEQNERTPGGEAERGNSKRLFSEMLSAVGNGEAGEEPDMKRPRLLESRGRRLFSPATASASGASCSTSRNSTSPTVRCLTLQLTSIAEETTSPVSRQQQRESTTGEPTSNSYNSPPAKSTLANGESTSAIFSPTTNLPNYVLNGEAPHLGIMSPKRKINRNVDWLTKIRKQKLMSSCRNSVTLSDKLNASRVVGDADLGAAHAADDTATKIADTCSLMCSPRLQSLRATESSPRLIATPRRRTSQDSRQSTQPKTPTSSRRNSKETLLRFFSVQHKESAAVAQTATNSTASCTATSETSSLHLINTSHPATLANAVNAE